jgi:hypothetical protein
MRDGNMKLKYKDIDRAVDGTDFLPPERRQDNWKGRAIDTGIKQGVGLLTGLLSGRKKSKEMQELLPVLMRINLRLAFIEHSIETIAQKLNIDLEADHEKEV